MATLDSYTQWNGVSVDPSGADPLDPSSREAWRVRRELSRQIGFLERRLSQRLTDSFGRVELPLDTETKSGGPRILSIEELESIRDRLVDRAAECDEIVGDRDRYERANRARLEEMIAEPTQFKGARVTQAEIGQPGCGAWEVRPRLGLIGMLMNWWRVVLSSGCP